MADSFIRIQLNRMSANGYTPTQKRILDLLADGLPHSRYEIHACLDDELSALRAIRRHISVIRQSHRAKDQDIVCEIYNRTVHYRHVRLLRRKPSKVSSSR